MSTIDAEARTRFRLGLQVLSYGATWSEVIGAVHLAEASGYDMILGADHLWATGSDPLVSCFEGWTSLAAWAATTERATLGLLVGANHLRNPGLVAKMAATTDHISAGRMVLGLGAGWWAREARDHGIDVGSGVRERIAWLDEAVTVIKALLKGHEVTSDGHYKFARVSQRPLPLHALPILMGATGDLALELAARQADIWHTWVEPGDGATYRAIKDRFSELCAASGRESGSVVRLPGCKMIIRDRRSEAEAIMRSLFVGHGWPEEVLRTSWVGTPEDIRSWLTALRVAGADGLILQVAHPYDVETISRLRELIGPESGPPALA